MLWDPIRCPVTFHGDDRTGEFYLKINNISALAKKSTLFSDNKMSCLLLSDLTTSLDR